MEAIDVLVVVMIALFVLLAWGIPIGPALGMTGTAGVFLYTGSVRAAINLPSMVAFNVTSTHAYAVIPLFILMGTLAVSTGISRELFDAAYKNVGRLPGGVAVATTFACAGFATVTGSSMASTMAMGKIALPEMRRFGYKETLATGTIASAGTFAMMIPPSIMLVVYAIFAQESVGALLLAGVIPGLVTAVVYVGLILIRTRLDPSLGPPGEAFSWKERLLAMRQVLPFAVVLLSILLGILLGVWTPVEAGAGGVMVVLILGFVRRRIGIGPSLNAIQEATIASASVFMIVIGSLMFAKFLALSRITVVLAGTVIGWGLSPFGLFVMFIIFYIALGCFLEGVGMLALSTPIVLPIVAALGWHPIWFGIIAVKLIEIAQVTPPVGLNLFALKSVIPEISITTIIRGILPFIMCDIVVLMLLYLFPRIALWLPMIFLAR